MAYTKQNFENGKVLTAEQLNRMDEGILEAAETAEALMQAKESGELNGKDGEPGKSAYDYAKEGGYIGTEAQFAAKLAQEYPAKVSDLTNDKGFITSADVPVKSVNGQTGAVSLSAAEVGARPSDWMPTAEQVGARPTSWTPTYSDVGAEKSGTASSAVSEHNIGALAHSDIRLLIAALANRMDALANSDDTTLDQLAEIVAYIKDNRGLIEQITTGKVSVSDIVNNLTTNVPNKPLSAAQGVALKALIDAIVIPTKLSQLTNDKGYLTSYTESDPTVPAWAKAASKPTYTAEEVGALSADTLPGAVNNALAQAKASGEFDGKDGQDGYTPVRNVDYWTEADREQIIQEVLTVLGMHIVGVVDAVNNIVLTGNLADGLYTVTYEDAEGNVTEVGTIELGGDEVINWLPIATDENGNIYNGTGYKENVRLSASSGYTETGVNLGDPVYLTGFIPVKTGDVLRFKGVKISSAADENYTGRLYLFDANKVGVGSDSAIDYANVSGWNVVTKDGYVTEITYGGANGYIRINADDIATGAIITINQEIV